MLTKALPTTLTTAHLLRVGTGLTLSAILFALAGCSIVKTELYQATFNIISKSLKLA